MLGIALYDPHRLNESDFLAGFVARIDLAEFLIAQLKRVSGGGTVQHRLIVGQRGMGKTTLLRRIAIGVSQDTRLSDVIIPLTFREEQYNVRTIDRFWRNCGESLAEWLEQTGRAEEARALDYDLSLDRWANPVTASDAFITAVQRLKRRPLLLVDNLDLILDAIPSEQHWMLRRALQSKSGPILYGASTQFPRQLTDPDEAFYEFFHVELLGPLTEFELIECIRRLAEVRGDAAKPVRDLLATEPQRLRVLHTLTGGNPRVLALIYQLVERAESSTVFSDLEALLDQMTPFYKARIEEIKTDLPRSIIDAVALNWDPITSSSIAKVTAVEITTVSSQLSRLKNQGLVDEVSTSGAKAGYQLAERFFNIWYLMRHDTRRTRQRMRWLTAFLESFYSVEQLRVLKDESARSSNAASWRMLYAVAIDEAISKVRRTLLSKERADQPLRGKRKSARVLERELRRRIEHEPSSPQTWCQLGYALTELKRHEEAEHAFLNSLQVDPSLVPALVGLGRTLADHLRRPDEAVVHLKRAVELEPDSTSTWYELAWALHGSGNYSECASAYRKLVELSPSGALLWAGLGHVLCAHLQQYEDGKNALEQAVKLDPKEYIPWSELGRVHHWLGDFSEAANAFRHALKLKPDDPGSLCGLGILLANHLNGMEEARSLYERATAIDPTFADGWSTWGICSSRLANWQKQRRHIYLD